MSDTSQEKTAPLLSEETLSLEDVEGVTEGTTEGATEGADIATGTLLSQNERIRGVFSTQEIKKVGTGATTRRTVQKTFWFVEQLNDADFEVQPLNVNYIPSGVKRTIQLNELLAQFAPEPEFYLHSVFPKMQELFKTIERGDDHREKGETFSAECEYSEALKVDEENVRANFGLGLTYLSRGESDKADDIFARLVKLDAAFDEEHKHLFNEFGISLRKNNMYDQAVDYYSKALELTDDDENLHINMARTLLEHHDYTECTHHLLLALKIAPENELAIKFLTWIKQHKLVPAEHRQEVADFFAEPLLE